MPKTKTAPKGARTSGSDAARSSRRAPTATYDAIVIGGGHNGLTNGAYLAKAGLRTLVLERRHLVGGAAITEELRPGFWFTTFSYALSLLRPDIVQELELVKHGFMPILMPTHVLPDGERRLPAARPGPRREPARRSRGTARTTPTPTTRSTTTSTGSCQAIKPLLDQAPPDIFSDDPEELIALADLGSRFRGSTRRSSTTRSGC